MCFLQQKEGVCRFILTIFFRPGILGAEIIL